MSDTSSKPQAALTLAVLAGLLVIGFVWGVHALTRPFPGAITTTDDEPASSCSGVADAGELVRPGQVTVSVLNAGTRSSLASTTLDAFADQGFVAGEVGNAPSAGVRRVAIWTDDPDSPATRLVRSALRGADVVQKATDQPGVVVVVGNAFTEVGTARRAVRAQADQPVC